MKPETTLSDVLLTALLTALASGLASSLLSYFFWRRQKKDEINYGIRNAHYVKAQEALMATWSLLGRMTDTENPQSILVWEKAKDKTVTYVLRVAQAQEFMSDLSEVFYKKGYGIFLNQDIKSLLFEYRSILYGLLLSEKSNAEPQFVVKNEEVVERMKKIYEELNKALQEEMNVSVN